MVDEGKGNVSQKLANGYYENTAYMDVIEKNDLESALDVKNQDSKQKILRRLIVVTNTTRAAWALPAPIILAVLHNHFLWAVIIAGIYFVVCYLIIHAIFKKTVVGKNIRNVIIAMIIADVCIVAAFVIFVGCFHTIFNCSATVQLMLRREILIETKMYKEVRQMNEGVKAPKGCLKLEKEEMMCVEGGKLDTVAVSRNFLNKDVCMNVAKTFMRDTGLSQLRIAKELYAHTVLYYSSGYVNQTWVRYLGPFASLELDYIQSHSNPINIGNDSALRVAIYDYLWNNA